MKNFSLVVLMLSLITMTQLSIINSWLSGINWYQYPVTEWIVGAYGDFIVVDPDYGPHGRPWSRDDIEWIKASGKKLIAYLNIGFAENWRDYWNETWNETYHPEWLVWIEYPGWPGEYFVKYWSLSAWEPDGWVDILYHELSKIIFMGFDGVRLDNIDVCKYWEDPSIIGLEDVLPSVENATTWMIYLVGNLSSYARSKNPDFIIQANMGGALDLLGNESFLESIDVVEREEVWYSNNTPVDPTETIEALYWLRYARDHGKTVFVIEYAWSQDYVLDAISEAEREGFYIYVALNYNLDRLPAYLPTYYGVDVDAGIVVWSYYGPLDSIWRSEWDVYVGFYSSGEVKNVLRVSSDGIDDYGPRIAFNPGESEALVVYTVRNSTGVTWVKAVFIDVEGKNVVERIVIARSFSDEYFREPDVAYYQGKYYVFYVNDTGQADLYLAVLNASTHNIINRIALTNTMVDEEYPVTVTTDDGVFILWRDSTANLHLALVDERGIVWEKIIDSNVEYRRYGLTCLKNKGLVIIYQHRDSGKAVLTDLFGNIISAREELPPITWEPYVLSVDLETIVYPSIDKLNFLRIKSIEYVESRPLKTTTTAGAGLLVDHGEVYVITPSMSTGNKLTVYSLGSPLKPVSEPIYTPLIIAFSIIVFILALKRGR